MVCVVRVVLGFSNVLTFESVRQERIHPVLSKTKASICISPGSRWWLIGKFELLKRKIVCSSGLQNCNHFVLGRCPEQASTTKWDKLASGFQGKRSSQCVGHAIRHCFWKQWFWKGNALRRHWLGLLPGSWSKLKQPGLMQGQTPRSLSMGSKAMVE